MWKTEGPLRTRAQAYARRLTPALVLATGVVSLATPLLDEQYWRRWFEAPGLYVALPMPLLVLGAAYALYRALDGARDGRPFGFALSLFLLSFIGLGVSIWPDLIPGRVSLWEAAAPYESQLFMLVGAVVLLPLILGYTLWAYWVFRGKVRDEGYH